MLTFFDYLRRRAFESVLAGAQDALAVLESQKNRSEPKPGEPRLPAPAPASQAGPPPKQPDNHSPQGRLSLADDDPLPAPRHRGRPDQRRNGKS